jgi:SP family sugar:H+ symporter-like MFS transporter
MAAFSRISDKAYDAMRSLRGKTYSDEEIDSELREITAFLEIERELEGSSTFMDCFRGTHRRRTIITIMVGVCNAFTGIPFITR